MAGPEYFLIFEDVGALQKCCTRNEIHAPPCCLTPSTCSSDCSRIIFLKHRPAPIAPHLEIAAVSHRHHAAEVGSGQDSPRLLVLLHPSSLLDCFNTLLSAPPGHTLLCLNLIHPSWLLTKLGRGPAMCCPAQARSPFIILTHPTGRLLGLLCAGREWALTCSPPYPYCYILDVAERGTQEYLLRE